jgi:hypothetical protein
MKNQYGFTPRKSRIEGGMAVKNVVIEGLTAGYVIMLVSLDVKSAFEIFPKIHNSDVQRMFQ